MTQFKVLPIGDGQRSLLGYEEAMVEELLETTFQTNSIGFIGTATEDYKSNLAFLARIAQRPQAFLRREPALFNLTESLETMFEFSGDSEVDLTHSDGLSRSLLSHFRSTANRKDPLISILEEFQLNLREHVLPQKSGAKFTISCFSNANEVWLLCFDSLGIANYSNLERAFLKKRNDTERPGGYGTTVMLSHADLLVLISHPDEGSLFAARVPVGRASLKKPHSKCFMIWDDSRS